MKSKIVGSLDSFLQAAQETVTPKSRISHLAQHELAHANQIVREKTDEVVDFGIMYVTYTLEFITRITHTYIEKKRVFLKEIFGAFVIPRSGLESFTPAARKRIAEAPGISEMSGDSTWGDWGVWTQADAEEKQEKWLESIMQSLEDSEEATTEISDETNENQDEYEILEPNWPTTSTSQDFELTPEEGQSQEKEEETIDENLNSDLLLLEFFKQALMQQPDSPTSEDLTRKFVESLYEPYFSKNEEANQELIDDFFRLVNSTLHAKKPEEPELASSQQNKHKQKTTIFKKEAD